MITFRDGRSLTGTAVQMVKQMQSVSFFGDRVAVGEDIDAVVERTLLCESVALDVVGATDELRCRSLVNELVRHGLAVRS